jgi:serine/threonine protein kinase
MAAELQGRLVGGWTIGAYLGNGFSAVVLSAEKEGQTAALKVIDPEMVERAGPQKQLARILREKELAGHGHPNLVDILDGGQCGETNHLYVAMELLEPRTLGQVRKKLPASRIGPLIGQLARATRFLEERGVAHRDIKPDNTVVSLDFSRVKLLDLGVIHPPADPNDPSAGTGDRFVGTARYSPPEFLYREEVDTVEGWRAITFYQLGATLYDLLMRRPIFDDFREPPARLYRAVKDHVPVIDAEDADPWLVDLARRCLHKDWRIRKELVNWDDFEGPRSTPESAQQIRERLKKRIEVAKTSASAEISTSGARPTRRTLDQLVGAMATMAREVCQHGGLFPPVEVLHIASDNKCVVTLRTGPSVPHELAGILEVRLGVEPLDAQAANVRITAAARLGAPPGEESAELFVGEPSAPALRDAIDSYLHATLEKALGTGTPPEAGLSVRHGMERL